MLGDIPRTKMSYGNQAIRHLFWKSILCITLLISIVGCHRENASDTLAPSSDARVVQVVETRLSNESVLVAGSNDDHLTVAFSPFVPGIQNARVFQGSRRALPALVEDDEGNTWDVFGTCIDGPHVGAQLKMFRSGVAYWYAWNTLFRLVGRVQDLDTREAYVPKASEDWLVSTDYVFRGSAHDGIPALRLPSITNFRERDVINGLYHLKDSDEVIVVKVNGQLRLYPIAILNYHEIINDTVGGTPIAISYAPYTGSSAVWSRRVGEHTLSFAVSGLVYNNNMLAFDRETNSYWSQLPGLCVHGRHIGATLDPINFLHTTWQTVRQLDREFQAVLGPTGYDFNYSVDPLLGYKQDQRSLPFPVSNFDNTMPLKTELFGVYNFDEVRLIAWCDY